jgi:hypothetical protein
MSAVNLSVERFTSVKSICKEIWYLTVDVICILKFHFDSEYS